jgi:hypothetical protein
MMRALWVPDEGAGGALVGTLRAPLPKPVRPLTPDEKATLAVFEDALVKMHSAGTLPPGALWIDARGTPSRAGLLDDAWLRRRLNDHASVKVGRLRK